MMGLTSRPKSFGLKTTRAFLRSSVVRFIVLKILVGPAAKDEKIAQKENGP